MPCSEERAAVFGWAASCKTGEMLAQFVRDHSFRAEVRDGVVWGEMTWTKREADGSVTSGADWEPVGTTFREARDWLGY